MNQKRFLQICVSSQIDTVMVSLRMTTTEKLSKIKVMVILTCLTHPTWWGYLIYMCNGVFLKHDVLRDFFEGFPKHDCRVAEVPLSTVVVFGIIFEEP